jgi:hypothetical protein
MSKWGSSFATDETGLIFPAGRPLVPLLETPRLASACRAGAAVTAIAAALPSFRW